MSLFPIIQVAIAILVIVLIIIQERGGGLGGIFGGGGSNTAYQTRRGFEKIIFIATIIGIIAFASLELIAFILN